MENNDSPYIYEKPLRSERLGQGAVRSKRLAKLLALGLVGMVGTFGGSAIASNVVTSPRAAADETASTNESVAAQDSASAPVISVPFQEAKPKLNSVKVELPALPNQSFKHEYENESEND